MTWKLCIQIVLLICWESDLVCTHENEEIYTAWPLCKEMRTAPDNRHPFHTEPRSSFALTASTQGGLLRGPTRCGLHEDTGRRWTWGLESCVPFAKAYGASSRSEVPLAVWSVASAGLDFPLLIYPRVHHHSSGWMTASTTAASGEPTVPHPGTSFHCHNQHGTLAGGKKREWAFLTAGHYTRALWMWCLV